MANNNNDLFELFPALKELEPVAMDMLANNLQYKDLKKGDIAYQPGWDCGNFLMCLSGQTRVFQSSESGREILLYRVGKGETCVLTTSCLMASKTFPAESIAEQDTHLAAIPAACFNELMANSLHFRQFVHSNYGELLSELIMLVNEVAFTRVDTRLARYLLKQAEQSSIIETTHQQLALDMGSVREVVSRHLNEWENQGLIKNHRGKIEIIDKQGLSGIV